MSTDLAKQEKKVPTDIRGLLQSGRYNDQFAMVLPKHLTAERFVRVALTAMTKTPKLAECDQASFFAALLTLSELGLEPDGRRAHLIPFYNKKKNITECQLIVDYKGIVELVMRGGNVAYIHADTVCERDKFVYSKGEIQAHEIDFTADRGPVKAVYALCRFANGMEKCEVMTVSDVEKIRNRSKAGTSGPWVSDWSEMAKKTVFRRLSKWLPFSPEVRDAIERDDDQFEHHAPSKSDELAELLASRIESEPEDEPETIDVAPAKKPPKGQLLDTAPNAMEEGH